MKKVILLSLLPVFTSSNFKPQKINYEEPIITLETKTPPPLIKEDELVRALIMVESRRNGS